MADKPIGWAMWEVVGLVPVNVSAEVLEYWSRRDVMDTGQGIKIYTPRNGIRCAVCHDPSTIALEAASDVEEWVQTIELCDTHAEILLAAFRVEMIRRERDADES